MSLVTQLREELPGRQCFPVGFPVGTGHPLPPLHRGAGSSPFWWVTLDPCRGLFWKVSSWDQLCREAGCPGLVTQVGPPGWDCRGPQAMGGG